MFPLACLALGVLLGLIGGLYIALILMQKLMKRLDEMTGEKLATLDKTEYT